MHIYLEDESSFIDNEEGLFSRIEQVINKSLDICDVPYEVEISLTIVSKEEIQSINKAHREMDKPTDVLSFPQIDPVSPGKIDWENLDTNYCMNFDTDEIILGDIILCSDIAKEQAIAFNNSLEREVCFLVPHSMLHLLGFDHISEPEEEEMINLQKHILNLLNIVR